jgi:hypothetical protein
MCGLCGTKDRVSDAPQSIRIANQAVDGRDVATPYYFHPPDPPDGSNISTNGQSPGS